MSFTRRSFLVGAGTGMSLLVLTACTDTPKPTPRPTPAPTNPVPTPSAVLRSAWSKDPFSRGAVSYLPVGATPQDRATLRTPLGDRVFFAGEATADEPGTVRGARNSGARIANQLADAAAPGEKIAVIGAGIAGAECARQLSALGFDVVVIEARDRTGGRIDTVSGAEGSNPVELGAWRFGEQTDAELLAALDRLDVTSIPLDGPALLRDSATPTEVTVEAATEPNPIGATAVTAAITWAGQQTSDSSLAAALDGSGAADTAAGGKDQNLAGTALLEQYLRTVGTITGAAPDQLSAWFAPVPTVESTRLVTGSLVALVDEALQGIDTFLSTAVVGISYDEAGVSLRLATGESLGVARAVVTVPLGVLKNDGIEFSPLLPFEYRAAIAALGMGNIETVHLSFDEAFWTTDAVAWTLVGTDDAITTWVNLLPITGEAALIGVVGADAAVALADLDDAEFVELARTSLLPFATA